MHERLPKACDDILNILNKTPAGRKFRTAGVCLLRFKRVFIAAKGVAFIAFIILKLVEAFAVNFVRVAYDDEGVFVKRFDRLLDLFYLVVFNAG